MSVNSICWNCGNDIPPNLFLCQKCNKIQPPKQIDEFKDALEDAIEAVFREIDETHKNLLISSQNVINEALNNKELDLLSVTN